MTHKYLLSLLLFCFFFSCKKNVEYKSEKISDWASNSMISYVVDSLSQTQGSCFITIRFYPSNDSNYVDFVKAVIKSTHGQPPVTDSPAFMGYSEIDSTALLVFWNYCTDSIFNKFVQRDRLNTNIERYDSLVQTLSNRHPKLRPSVINDRLTRIIFLIKNDSLVFIEEEYI